MTDLRPAEPKAKAQIDKDTICANCGHPYDTHHCGCETCKADGLADVCRVITYVGKSRTHPKRTYPFCGCENFKPKISVGAT